MTFRALFLAGLAFLSGCNAQRFFMVQAVGSLSGYFDHPTSATESLDEVAPGVLTFQTHWERALIVQTRDGLVISDPFNPTFARALRARLEREGLWEPVRAVIYSHHHLDHVGGAAILEPAEVIAHADVPEHWAQSKPRDVLPPTRLVSGDTRLSFGSRTITLVSIPHAHAETHFALHVNEKVLYAPDTLAPGVMLLGGLPATPLEGYFEDLAKLGALPFDVFVASHFGYAPKAEFDRTVTMLRDLDTIGRDVVDERWHDGGFHVDKAELKAAFKDYYDRTHAKYGDWHGVRHPHPQRLHACLHRGAARRLRARGSLGARCLPSPSRVSSSRAPHAATLTSGGASERLEVLRVSNVGRHANGPRPPITHECFVHERAVGRIDIREKAPVVVAFLRIEP